MNRPRQATSYHASNRFYSSISSMTLVGVLAVLAAGGVTAQNPAVTVRFANPQFDGTAGTYSLDVEFQSSAPNQQLFGMNVRFYYDDAVLEFDSFYAFQNGYGPVSPNPPAITTASPASGPAMFGLAGAAEYVNGAVQLVNPSAAPLYLATSGWTKLFSVSFKVVNPAAVNGAAFCPAVIWDLKTDPAEGGFLPGSNGVVMTLVSPPPAESAPSDEQAVQFNWHYANAVGMPYGYPAAETCVEPKR